MAIGVPGCPEFAAWTASIDSVRMVATDSSSGSVMVMVLGHGGLRSSHVPAALSRSTAFLESGGRGTPWHPVATCSTGGHQSSTYGARSRPGPSPADSAAAMAAARTWRTATDPAGDLSDILVSGVAEVITPPLWPILMRTVPPGVATGRHQAHLRTACSRTPSVGTSAGADVRGTGGVDQHAQRVRRAALLHQDRRQPRVGGAGRQQRGEDAGHTRGSRSSTLVSSSSASARRPRRPGPLGRGSPTHEAHHVGVRPWVAPAGADPDGGARCMAGRPDAGVARAVSSAAPVGWRARPRRRTGHRPPRSSSTTAGTGTGISRARARTCRSRPRSGRGEPADAEVRRARRRHRPRRRSRPRHRPRGSARRSASMPCTRASAAASRSKTASARARTGRPGRRPRAWPRTSAQVRCGRSSADVDVDLGGAHAAPGGPPRRSGDRSPARPASTASRHAVERRAGVDQRAEQHVARDAGEASIQAVTGRLVMPAPRRRPGGLRPGRRGPRRRSRCRC